MRYLKIAFAGLVTLVAMFASLVIAFVAAIGGLVVYLLLRLFGRRATVRFGSAPRPPRSPASSHDVIDVTATEVSSKQLER